jgi:hypothetical protein
MWHSLVEYRVCYSMFHSERTKVFPWVVWPGLGWPEMFTILYKSFSSNNEPGWA